MIKFKLIWIFQPKKFSPPDLGRQKNHFILRLKSTEHKKCTFWHPKRTFLHLFKFFDFLKCTEMHLKSLFLPLKSPFFAPYFLSTGLKLMFRHKNKL